MSNKQQGDAFAVEGLQFSPVGVSEIRELDLPYRQCLSCKSFPSLVEIKTTKILTYLILLPLLRYSTNAVIGLVLGRAKKERRKAKKGGEKQKGRHCRYQEK